ncbi:hypothetical protein [Lysobacter antibioticus]|uniref:hypothetical protein n=1 Tax=Lysobacter antibioticus TaxID=84531 RepID=UPI0011876307|nr:hypothetical protein [Lysobacter antibioticus]
MFRKFLGAFIFLSLAVCSFSISAADNSAIFDAGEVARKLFIQKLGEEPARNTDLSRYIRNINNYDVGIGDSGECYVVVFRLRDRRIIGGGGEVWVRKSDREVVKFSGYE